MEEAIVLGRIGHYFDAGNGGCSTAIVVAGGAQHVNVQAWHQDGSPFARTSVPVNPTPAVTDDRNSFHLTRDCPFGR